MRLCHSRHSGSTAAPRAHADRLHSREVTLASALQAAGRDAELIHAGYNHFEINEALGCAGTVPHAAAVEEKRRDRVRRPPISH